MRPRYFRSPAELRRWLAAHHGSRRELWVGFRKKASGRPSVTYPEALDEALCVGWIDGVRRSVDAESYTIRFTPRRPGSIWSRVNIAKVEALIAAGRMKKPGRDAFERRSVSRQVRYSYENKPRRLSAVYERTFKTNARAWTFFETQAPWYRRTASFWVMSAVKDETRSRRLKTLIAESARNRRIGPLANRRARKKR